MDDTLAGIKTEKQPLCSLHFRHLSPKKGQEQEARASIRDLEREDISEHICVGEQKSRTYCEIAEIDR